MYFRRTSLPPPVPMTHIAEPRTTAHTLPRHGAAELCLLRNGRPVVSRCFRELATQRPALPTIPFYHPSGAMCLEEIIDVIMAMQP